MGVSNELKKIKKVYGENFMKSCRDLFPTLLEQEGRLYEILSSSFSDNCKNLYEDIIKADCEEEFKSYIYSKVDVENPEKKMIEEKTPYELLKKVGYNLTECLTEEEIQKFKRYYKPREELCTFRGGRLNSCVVFWAVKENAEDIKREDFDNPKREDEYGTSVMGIQFNKHGRCTVSIKNRYNHTVNNPDATYGNDLDRIAPGLTKSFEKLLQRQYGLELNSSNLESFELPGYVVANDGKYYKYNMEIHGAYYCPGNIVIKNGEVTHIGKPEEGILIDYFYIDKKNKTIKVCGDIEDSFVDDLQKIENIEVVKSEDENINRIIKVYLQDIEEPVLIGIDENNQIVKYVNKNVTIISDEFLGYNKGITKLELPNLTLVGDEFLSANEGLNKLELLNLTQVGNDFLLCNKELTRLEMPNLIRTGDNFLYYNKELTRLELPNLIRTGSNFLNCNKELTRLELPNLIRTGDNFLYYNKELTRLELPNLIRTGDYFLYYNKELTKLELPNLTQVGDKFLEKNEEITELELPKLTQVGDYFLGWNKGLTKLKLLKLTRAGDRFLSINKELTKLELPRLTQVGDDFLGWNKGLTKLEFPRLTQVGDDFLCSNKMLIRLEVPKLPELRKQFSEIIDRNASQESGNRIITPKSIAQLDTDNELTTSEMSSVSGIIKDNVSEKTEKQDIRREK